MVFSESALKDVYRLWAWGPWRLAMERAPGGWEVRANRALGRVAGQALRGHREALRLTLREALGIEDVDGIVDQVFATHFANQYVGFSFHKMRAGTMARYLRLDGIERLDAALAEGRGAVIAHPHMALPQLPLHALGVLGYDVHQVGGGRPDLELSPIGERVTAMRGDLEQRICATLHDGSAYLRPLLRVLEAGGIVFTACDGTGGGRELGRRQVVAVLGQPLRVPVFPVWLARRTGAALLPMVTHQEARGPLFAAGIEEAIPPGEAAEMVDALGGRLEEWLRDHPGDWHFWDKWHDGPGGLFGG